MRLPPALSTALAATTITTTTLALPTNTPHPITAEALLKIAPTTSTCTNAPANAPPGECRTAAQAAPYLSISFTNFALPSFNVQAALTALILYESGNFKYSRNVYPGVPGQGTRNMQSPEYNLRYATWLATVCEDCGIAEGEVERAKAEGPAAVLGLVNSDEWGFGSAAWFYSTVCEDAVKQGVESGTEEGWNAYLSQCVQTSVTEERTAIWRKAVALKEW